MRFSRFLVAGLVVATFTLAAQEPAVENAAPTADKKVHIADENRLPSGEEIRCEYQRPTGSKMVTKVCRSENEWQQIKQAAQEGMRDMNAQPIGLDESGP